MHGVDPPGEDGPEEHVAGSDSVNPAGESVLVVEEVHLAQVTVSLKLAFRPPSQNDRQQIQGHKSHHKGQKGYKITVAELEDLMGKPNGKDNIQGGAKMDRPRKPGHVAQGVHLVDRFVHYSLLSLPNDACLG